MKDKLLFPALFAVLLFASACLTTAPVAERPPERAGMENVPAALPPERPLPAKPELIISETFNNGLNAWLAENSGRGSIPPRITREGDNNALEFASQGMNTGGRSSVSCTVKTPQLPLELFFKIKTDIGSDVETALVLYIDEKKTASFNGLYGSWNTHSFSIAPATAHTIKWVLEKNSDYYYDTSNKVWLDDIELRTEAEPPSIIYENFETGINAGYRWLIGGAVTPVITQAQAETSNYQYFGNSSRFLKLGARAGGLSILELKKIAPDTDSALSFRFKTEIDLKQARQTFKVYVDGKETGSWTGLKQVWRTETIFIPRGEHSIRFEVSSAGIFIVNGLNAVYLDDISLVPDRTDRVVVYPRGKQETYIGADSAEMLRFRAEALRSDGSVRKGALFSFTVSGGSGSVNPDGVFTPSAPGTYTITARADGKSASNSQITVHPQDYMRRSYTWQGTGKTYRGYEDKGTGSLSSANIRIDYPTAKTFNADGFFTLEGKVTKPNVYNYAFVEVYKLDSPALKTRYLLRDQFSMRIWLRFGPGAYTVNVYEIVSINLSAALGSEGDYSGAAYSSPPFASFSVTNTRGEDGPDGDGRWIYPSGEAQSDNFVVINLLNDICWGLNSEEEKIQAIHDYIVRHTVYDAESFLYEDRRKKQDALTVLKNGLAVCQGYSNTAIALLRAAGIPSKRISSNRMNHGWINIFVNGKWKMADITWDDPQPDNGPNFVQYKYYLLDDFRGVPNRDSNSPSSTNPAEYDHIDFTDELGF
ncbi:MAG: transglutaminase domain-containing protein [Treponema sp.]|jgi:hypothetical protein|nr:transglutaminase domain-containing protein [Treponema sp.]